MTSWAREQQMEGNVDGSYYFTSEFDGECVGFNWPTAIISGLENTVGEGDIAQAVTVTPYKKDGISSFVMHRVSSK